MEKNNVKVSFIIPCYNVEKYVEKCVYSISEQTVKDIEIILIDDGSPDKTGEILDRLSGTDSRIKVIHQKNAGVSAARNTGLEVAVGKYIVFVDGDDYLASDFVEYMLQLTDMDNSDFVMSQNCFTKGADSQISKDILRTLTPAQATALLISPRVIVGCWNKMFKKKFLDDNKLTFSTNLFYGEGLNFITRASQLAKSVTVGERKVYYYRRNNEISATTRFNIQKYHNGEVALNKISDELLVNDTEVLLMVALHKSLFCLGAISQTYAHDLQEQFAVDIKHWKTIIVSNLPRLLCSSKVPTYRKFMLLGGILLPSIICKLDMWRRKKISENSIK